MTTASTVPSGHRGFSLFRLSWIPAVLILALMGPLRFLFTFEPRDVAAQQGAGGDSWSPAAAVRSTTSLLATAAATKEQEDTKIVLYITTHFSDAHIRYFHCCWPTLVRESPLIRQSHVIVAATNATPVPLEELQYLQTTLFRDNPSYQFWTPPTDNASHLSHCEPFKTPRNPNKKGVSVSYKQCLANFGVAFGWSRLISQNFDWMIRLNPDVLIRQSQWFLQAMKFNRTLDAILVHCGPGTRQIHTDFWAIRPAVLLPQAQVQVQAQVQDSNNINHTKSDLLPFQHMGRIGMHLNHERTAFQHFRPILSSQRYAWVPHVAPSQGVCRVRGSQAWVSHEHDSCTSDVDMICHGLEGWNLTN